MPEYRRFRVPGGIYFFTLVTHDRRRFLTTELARDCLRLALRREQAKRPFEIIAFVLLPDHLHAIWALPRGDADYSRRWAGIKEHFTREFLNRGGEEGLMTESRLRRRERMVWQRRFWEHTCQDEGDLENCIRNIHWNPKKHGLVDRVQDYPYSSFHRFVRKGDYDIDWGGVDPDPESKFADFE